MWMLKIRSCGRLSVPASPSSDSVSSAGAALLVRTAAATKGEEEDDLDRKVKKGFLRIPP